MADQDQCDADATPTVEYLEAEIRH
jgi:hypothetical protein